MAKLCILCGMVTKPKSPLSAQERTEALRLRRRFKMTRSAQTYLRGSTTRFYAWLEEQNHNLPEGPPVWICGDCHYGNLGPIGGLKDDVAIQIRDLDQTVIGNPAHDLIRLTLSLAGAVRGFDLPGSTTARMIETMVGAYQASLNARRRKREDAPPTIKGLVRASQRRTWRQLAQDRIDDPSPSIPLGKRFWALDKVEREALKDLVASPDIHALITSLTSRPNDAPVSFVDAAYWVKGCSSLGLLRYAILAQLGEGKDREFLLVDVKQAVRAAAPRTPDADMPRDNGERVVAGARALSPYLGERMCASRVLDNAVFVRELRPQDLKLEMDALDADEMVCVAGFLAGVIGRAHARQLDQATCKQWASELDRNRSKSLDAPSWLWSSVVELLQVHEGAYLDHCRRYANIAA